MNIKNPTLRKLQNRGLQAIRYRGEDQVCHGWIVSEGARGSMVIHLVGHDRNTRLSVADARFVSKI